MGFVGLARSSAWWASDLVAACMYVMRGRRPRPGLTVLAYCMAPLPPWSDMRPDRFSDQLKAIGLTKGVSIVGLSQVERWRDDPPERGSYVLLTFDDGLHCQLHAAAELSRYALSAAFFIPSEPVRSHTEEPLDPDGIRLLVRLGMDVQPHGREHRRLAELSPDELEREVDDSLEHCSRFAHPYAFAYPFGNTSRGDVTPEIAKVLSDRDIRIAFTTDIGPNPFERIRDDPLLLKRTPMALHDRRLFAQAKASGYTGPLPALRRIAFRIGRALGR